MAKVEVVKIKHKTAGFCLINKTDYDPAIHELFIDDEQKPEEKINLKRPRKDSKEVMERNE